MAEKLLMQGNQPEVMFIGAQALYQKLQNDYDFFTKDAEIRTLRDSLFQIVPSTSISDNDFL